MELDTNPITLGEFIGALEKCDNSKDVYFEFANYSPTRFDSYRGYYEQLALGFKEDASMTVSELLESAKKALGHTFEGYKGGFYTMFKNTPVWAANYGRSNSTAIIGVKECKYAVYILTINQDLFDD